MSHARDDARSRARPDRHRRGLDRAESGADPARDLFLRHRGGDRGAGHPDAGDVHHDGHRRGGRHGGGECLADDGGGAAGRGDGGRVLLLAGLSLQRDPAPAVAAGDAAAFDGRRRILLCAVRHDERGVVPVVPGVALHRAAGGGDGGDGGNSWPPTLLPPLSGHRRISCRRSSPGFPWSICATATGAAQRCSSPCWRWRAGGCGWCIAGPPDNACWRAAGTEDAVRDPDVHGWGNARAGSCAHRQFPRIMGAMQQTQFNSCSI